MVISLVTVFTLLDARHVYRPSSAFCMVLIHRLPFRSVSVGGWDDPTFAQLIRGSGSPVAWQLYTGLLPEGSEAPLGIIVKLGGTGISSINKETSTESSSKYSYQEQIENKKACIRLDYVLGFHLTHWGTSSIFHQKCEIVLGRIAR